MAFANQRRKVDKKKVLAGKQVDDTAMKKVQLAILKLIGGLDPTLSQYVIPQDPDSLAAAAVRWDCQKHVRFALPFGQTKIDIYLDDILPRVVDLALNSSDRQTKVAASELLHSTIIVMIGIGSQQQPEIQEKDSMALLYRHIFQAMLQLACDPDQVTRQLFATLAFQIIHWFTNNTNYENPDTAVLLEAIMSGIVMANNPALRDISAQCLAEFVKWSRKQSRGKDSASLNLKSILKRIFSFCKHPSAFKRLGGSLAWNSIYREVREDATAVDTWTLEILSHLMLALDLAQADDPAIGTHEQTKAAILRVQRILVVKKELFWEKSPNRRTPVDFEGGTFEDVLMWLLKQCGSPKTLVRHICMELLETLAPHAKNSTSVHAFVERHLQKPDSVEELVDIIEGGGQSGQGIRDHADPAVFTSEQVTGNHLRIFFEGLLAALDGYSWLIGKGIVRAERLLKCKESKIFKAYSYFLKHMAIMSIPDYLKNTANVSETETLKIPLEYESWTRLKCTVVVRVLDFLSVLLQDGVQSVDLLDQYSIWTVDLYQLLLQCVMDPSSVGFDIRDTEVTKHLPSRLEEILKVMKVNVPQQVSKAFIQFLEETLEKVQFDIMNIFASPLAESADVSLKGQHTVEGLEVLQKSGWLRQCSVVRESLALEMVGWVCGSLFSTQGTGLAAVSPEPAHLPFLCSVLDVSVTLDSEVLQILVKQITNTEPVKSATGQQIQKGIHILNILGPKIIPHILPCCDLVVATLLELIKEGNFLHVMGLSSILLNTLIKNADLRKKYSARVVQVYLHHWSTFSAEARKSSMHQESVLDLLSSLFIVDREGVIKEQCCPHDIGILSFYQGLLVEDKTTLSMKNKALKLLPFFLTMSAQVSESICKDLAIVSFKHFPILSSEFLQGGSRDRDYQQALSEMLTALELSLSLQLLKFIVQLYCREDKHRYEELFSESLEKFIKRQSVSQQLESQKLVYDMFANPSNVKQNARYNIMDKALIPFLQLADLSATVFFYTEFIKPVMVGMSVFIQGRSEEQLRLLVTKIGSFKMLQVMFSRLPRERVFHSGSEISAAYKPSDASCKEMTKEVLLQSSRVAKGELRHDTTQAELRRLCACAAYNTATAVLVCVKDDLRFYTSILFCENPARGEAIWESLIDCDKNFQFDIEVNFNPSRKRRFVTVRREMKKANQSSAAGTVQYLASHYLDDSSLREDVSQFDFSNSVVLAMSQKEDSQQRIMPSDSTGELWTMVLEQNDYNEHDVMANLTAAIYHMMDAKIMELYQGDMAPPISEVPSWMSFLVQKLENRSTHRNVKLFLLRLMMNTTRVFSPYAVHFINPVLTCLVDGTTGDRINYFFCDLIVMVLGWGKKAVTSDNTNARAMVSKVLEFLCSNTPHNRADVFKYNIDVVRSVVECWKTFLTVPYGVIFSFMEVKDGKNREQEAGLHLLGIMLANDIAPYTEGYQAEKTRCEKLLLRLLDGHYASVYGAAAEVVGLVLKYQSTREEEHQGTSWQNSVVSKVLEVLGSNQGHGITIIYKIHLHFPAVINKFISRLLIILPRLYGIFRTRVLECLGSYLSCLEDFFSYFKEQNILGLLEKREESTQLVSLELVRSVLHRLSPPQLLYFLPGVTAFSSHPSAKCRETMYEILFWVYDNCRGELDSEAKQIEVKARVSLLQAMREKDAALKQSVLNYWLEQFKSLSLPQRVLHILQKIYSPESEESFLELAMYILLEETRYSADYQRDIFQQPLTLCRFREMRVSTAWRARHASMIPLFMETQSSSDASLVSLTQGTEAEDDPDASRRVEVTQSNVFSATQQAGATFNWVTESTFSTMIADKEYAATHAPVQASAAQPMFTVGTSDSGQPESKLIRKRFVKEQDREKQHLYYAKLEERRSKMRATLEKERKSRREAQVTLYRQYRVGELPDIQIPHRAVIAPLQALSQRDDKVAQMLFDVVVQGVVDNAPVLLPTGEDSTWKQQLSESLNKIISESYMCRPDMLRALLHIVINNDIPVSPEALAAACLGGHLEALGILVLERQVLVSQGGRERSLPPPAKRQRTSLQSIHPDTSTWINIAELYKSLSMWDVVRGVVHGGLGRIKPETREALEAEATGDYVEAFNLYRMALNTHWDEEPKQAEVQLWEESYASCAAMLGQWSELEKFVETRILHCEAGQASLDHMWTLPRPTVSVLPSIVNSKLMNILDSSESDKNLCAFIDAALGEPERQVMLESTLPLQLAIMSVHQEKMPQARHYVTVATSKALLTLAQSSLLIAKPVIGAIRDIQLITEFGEFLETLDHANSEYYPTKVRQTVKNWKNQATSVTDSSFLMQFLSSHRDLYLHFIEKELPQDCLQDIQQLMKDTKASLHKSIIKTALRNKNYHLANRHLKKFKQLCEDDKALAQFYFFMTETIVQRGHSRHQNTLKYLVEAWSKCLGKVNAMAVMEQDIVTQIEYLKLESSVGMEVFEALEAMGGSWDEGNEFIKSLFHRFPNARGRLGLYREILGCVYGNLNMAIKHAENSLDQVNSAYEGVKDQGKDIYMILAKYCDSCLEKWKEHINATEYAESLVVSVLRAMALGSHEAHFYFPRLINLMNDNPNLVEVFKEQAGNVPVWMFLLWINHILVYADKPPSAALQPIIEELAKEYPQAIVYPFRISKQQYDFTGDAGKATKAMCERVESLLCKNTLLHHFVTAISLVAVPDIALRESFKKLFLLVKKEDIEVGLKNIITDYLKVDNRSTKGMPGERGEAFCKRSKLVKNVDAALTKYFGEGLAKIKKMSAEDIKKGLQFVTKIIQNSEKAETIPKQLKAYSPWLANFQASKHSDLLEIPGQYSGMSKPLPAYHVNISSFDGSVMPMISLRYPIRIVIRGSDEKDHKYLVKWGEDLRTDQRVQQVFTLMNSLYSSSRLCAHTSFHPSLDTYQIVPLSLKAGILKWVESTQSVKEFIKSSFREGEAKCYEEARKSYMADSSWVLGTKQVADKRVVKRYVDTVNKIPWDILRRGLIKLSNSNEGFFFLRSVFANSYATMCVSHWLLGVGDRHSGNILMSLKTGRAVGIDFGHHFESSVQFLPVPELMPFRLTPQIVNVFQPLGHAGMMKDVMVAVLGALQESRHMILAVLETFVKEPTQDWLDFARIQEGDVEGSKVEMFSEERLRFLKGKLSGFNPSHITVWALSKNKYVVKNPTVLESLKKIVLGTVDESTRASMGRDGLTVHQQVDALLEQATDPNILGRTWLGWEPFM